MNPKYHLPLQLPGGGALLAALLLTTPAWATTPIPVTNAGFETPVLGDGNNATLVPAWTNVAGGGEVFNPTTSQYATEAPEGANVASIFSGAAGDGLSQILTGATGQLQADATYALTVLVGDPADSNFDGYKVQLLADGTVLAEDDNTGVPSNGGFATATVNYVYNVADAALVGKPLEIRLLSKGLLNGDVNFDNVQLAVTLGNPVANPGGPYTAFIGGSLSLNGNGSIPSGEATITAYDWDLDNDGLFDEGITGATPPAIPQADLISTHGMSLGSNTIKLRVTDSATKTSTVETTVSILPATAVVYEPFAYSGTILNGASGTTEVGLEGAWTANTASGLADNLTYGALVTRGGGVGNFGAGGNTYGGGRAVSASALAANGLLNDGATLWFSVIMGYDSGGNRTNTRLAMVLGDESMGTGNFQYYFPTAGATGLGVTMGRVPNINGRLVATQVRDSTFGASGFGGNVFGTLNSPVYPGSNANRDVKLVIGRITWGASEDTIDIFVPDENLQVDLETPHSTLTVTVDQSGYDTISLQRGDRVVWDEIRFGATYASVTETGSYWDLNDAVAGSGSATPSGTWNTGTNWNEAIDGTGATAAWAAGGTAVFSAGDDATGNYTITVDGTQDVGGVIAEDGTVAVSGGTALRLTTNGSISVADGLTATIATPFIEDAAGRVLSKSGTGTVILSGDNSGVTGGMVISSGAAQFEAPSAIAGTARDAAIGIAGAAAFGPGFGAGNIPTALLERIDASSTGTIAVDHQAATDFDFATPGLTGAYLGAVGDVTYTGTLTPNGTTYRLGGGGGTLTMGNPNALTGANSLLVRGSVVLGADNDYTGATTVPGDASLRIMGATATSGIAINQPASLLELGADGALGTGALTVNGGFGASPKIAAVANSANTNPVNGNGNFDLEGTGTLTLGVVTFNGNRTINNYNTTGTTTFAGFDGANRTITLSGNGSTTVGDITTGTGGLTKNGSGTLTLTGANTYTGNTAINSGGTLALAGGSQTSAITVANGATLDFTLGSPSTSTAALTLSGGHAIAITGAVDNASNYLLMTAAAINGTPNLADPVTDYELQLLNGNQELWLVFTGGGSPYGTWAATNAPTGNPDDDYDRDGVSNAVEFVLGGDKDTNDLDKLPVVATDGTNLTFTFVRDQTSIAASVTVTIEVGTDLATWPASYSVPAADTGGVVNPGVTVVSGAGTDTVTLTVAQDSVKKFARLKVVVATL